MSRHNNDEAGRGLARRLGLFDATMIVMGGIVGSGIFINPYVVAQQVRRAAVCACKPPTPPQPAIATNDEASFCCSSDEISPRLRSNASVAEKSRGSRDLDCGSRFTVDIIQAEGRQSEFVFFQF